MIARRRQIARQRLLGSETVDGDDRRVFAAFRHSRPWEGGDEVLWNRKGECGARSDGATHLKFAAHRLDEALADRQTKPRSAEAPGGGLIGLREGAKDIG